MKKFSLLTLLLSGMAFAAQPGASSIGPNITGCLKWSIPYFCKKFFGNYTQAVTEGCLCQSQNGGDSFSLTLGYTNDPNYPPTPFYWIFWQKCLKYEIGSIAPSGSLWNQNLTTMLGDLFDHPILVSEFMEAPTGDVRVYVMDSPGETLFEGTWTAQGELLDFRAVDPETDESLRITLMEQGIGFATLQLP